MIETKVAIVTGGAQGIGLGIVEKLARQGIRVIMLDVNDDQGRANCETLRKQNLGVDFMHCDVGTVEDIKRCVEAILKIDYIVNNAGYGAGRPLSEMSVDDFDRIINVNLRASFLFAKFAIGKLQQSSCAAIVNIASTRALQSEAGDVAYSASKAGLLGLTQALAIELGPAVRVNAISPGWIDVRLDKSVPLKASDHAQHPVGRVGVVSDVANMVSFLLSSEASFITGQNFLVDGGMTKKMIYEP